AVQRWYEWRGTIARAVQVAVDTYMAEYSEDPTVRAAHATFMKGNSERIPFAWRFHPCSSEEPSSYQGLFLSPFISAGLAAHFNMTSSVCEELMVDSEPRGALALATVSAKRGFMFWVTGNSTAGDPDRKEESKFSEANWGVSTMSYFPSIAKLRPRQWEKINEGALELLPTPRHPLALSLASSSPVDARGLLFEEDSD
ncbi:hypothetical protein BDZ97DRAFT_1661447, partial [Flammula alnicola]